MATRQTDGSIKLNDGRIIYANSLILGQDLPELVPLFSPPPVWPFVSGGGGGGAGTPGAKGADGAAGPQGNQGPGGAFGGPQGNQGFQGSGGTGPQGNQGAQGNQGNAGTNGAQGNQGSQGTQGLLSNDIFAAFRVVDPGGAGTDLTIATAVAAVNAAPNGGDIYIKPGVYSLAAGFVFTKPVRVRGAGNGRNGVAPQAMTVLTLATAGMTLFDTSGAEWSSFADFLVVGDGGLASDQTFLRPGGNEVNVERVDVGTSPGTDSIRTIVATSSSPEVTFRDCRFRMPNSTTASFWRGLGTNGLLTWDNVECQLFAPADNLVFITGIPNFTIIDSYFGGPGGMITFLLNQVIWTGFRLDNANVTVNGAASRMEGCEFTTVTVNVNATECKFIGDRFSINAAGANAELIINGVGGVGNCIVSGCAFSLGNRGIQVVGVTGVAITGCTFESQGTDGVEASGTSTLSVVGCRFSDSVPVNELATTVTGRYTGNEGFEGSVIVGPDSTTEEVRRKDVTAAATVDALTPVFTHANDKGLTGAGSIKNTGANSLTVRRTGIDGYGVTDFQEDVVLAGAVFTWPMDTALGTALPAFVSFMVSVKSTTPGSPTTYSLRHSSAGAY